MQGENYPPLHPRCRCTVTAALGEDLPIKRKSRIAERREKLDGGVTYKEWLGKYVEKTFYEQSNDAPHWKTRDRTKVLSKETYQELRELAVSKGISLVGVKLFDGSPKVVQEIIETISDLKKVFPLVSDVRHKIELEFSIRLADVDFAETKKRIITLNANAYRDVRILQEEYQKLVDEGWFVKGTDWRAIIHHEFGHVVANVYKIDPLKIACEVTGLDSESTLKYLEKNLSKYAASYPNGQEIISEVFADMTTDNPSDFSRKFYEQVLGFR